MVETQQPWNDVWKSVASGGVPLNMANIHDLAPYGAEGGHFVQLATASSTSPESGLAVVVETPALATRPSS